MPLRSCLALMVVVATVSVLAAEQNGENRYAVVLESQPAAGGPAEDSSALRSVLAENGYQGAPLRKSNPEWRLAASPGCLTVVFNTLQFKTGATLLVYYNGTLSLQGGGIQVHDAAGKPMQLMSVFDRLEGKLKNSPSVAVLLDVRSAERTEPLLEAVRKVLPRYQANVSVLIGRRRPDDAAVPPPLATWLRRALMYDRCADSDGNGRLTMAELERYVRGKLAGGAELGLVASSASGSSMEIGRFGTATLDGLIQGLADEVPAVLEREPCDLVAIPDFADSGPAAFAGGQRSDTGILQRYLAAQLRARLGLRLGTERIVTHDRLVEALKKSQITPATSDKQLDKLTAAVEPKGTIAVLRGSTNIDLQADSATLTAAGRLVMLRPGEETKTVALHTATAKLVREESAMTGCLNMSPAGNSFPGLEWRIGELGGPVELARHPMSNDRFPLRVYLKVNGRPAPTRFSEDRRQLYASVKRGDEYSIVIENRSEQDLFLRLLVDGRNTLPDRAWEGAEKLEPAQYVSLTCARCWFCEAGQTYHVGGFYTSIDAKQSGLADAELRRFQVTDAQREAPTEEFRDQLGIITAAFYECVERQQSPMAAQPRYATTLGEKRKGTVEIYDGDKAPGPLLGDAPINIRYGF